MARRVTSNSDRSGLNRGTGVVGILGSVVGLLTLSDRDFDAARSLGRILLSELYLRLVSALLIGLLAWWTSRPLLAAIWLGLIILNELIELVFMRWLFRTQGNTHWPVYVQFANWFFGGSLWAGLAFFIWLDATSYEKLFALAILLGSLLHVIFNYTEWLKGLIFAAIPMFGMLFILPVLDTLQSDSLQNTILMFLAFGLLTFYLINTTAMNIARQRELKSALENASSANEAKSTFLANMSHEIRTPMNGVLGMADLLKRTELNEKQKEMVQVIESSGDTLLRVIGDVLDLSKVEAGHLELEQSAFDLDDTLRTIIATSQLKAMEKEIDFGFERTSECGACFVGDETRLRQIANNLISNAIKFTENGGVFVKIDVQKGETDETCTLMLKVTDTGRGLSDDEQEDIFRPFVQIDPSLTRAHGGTGLGLTIARELATIMGGEMSVESRKGEGSTFSFRCPLQVIPPDECPCEQSRVPEVNEAPTELRILVADDHPQNRLVIGRMLEAIGANVTFAHDGREAVTSFSEESFDLVLMDIQMPELNGVEALKEIRAYEKANGLPPTPIIAVSANAMKHQVEQYLWDGFNAHISKPVVLRPLVSTIARTLTEES